ncbi:MAG: DNA polymerase Y family protein [Gammaproteobacteria bacterium]
MSSRPIRTGRVRPEVSRLRAKVSPSLAPPPPPQQALAFEPRELWVGLHLPWLEIEALQQTAGKTPRAIVELQGQTQYVVAACERAQRFGVRRGMGMAAALALVPDLETCARDATRERQLLERLATRAYRFTPRVSLVPPDGLVLEVKGSLHLFGGAEGLCRALESDCFEAGVKPIVSLAPSPLAALAGARAGKSLLITDATHLVGEISALKLFTLRWPAEVIERLRQVGVYTVGQVLRLPRAGFARRFGREHLAELDRLTGRDADLRDHFRLRERFRRKKDLLQELEHHESILSALTSLLEELGEFLKVRQCGVTQIACLLKHRRIPRTRCVLRFAAPAANARHFAKLFAEKLSTLNLSEPVRGIELRSGDLVPCTAADASLWQPGEYGGETRGVALEIIEHLRARLGHESVYGLRVLESHRPETSWAVAELGGRASKGRVVENHVPWFVQRRPAWLLREPQPLSQRKGLPRHHGELRFLEGPDRVEAGMAVQGRVSRDYYIVRDSRGVRLWIFRDLKPPREAASAATSAWFLQGILG